MKWYIWRIRLKHWFIQLFKKPTCTFCTLACEPQYGECCEICDEAPK
jgi:hypothetical protein